MPILWKLNHYDNQQNKTYYIKWPRDLFLGLSPLNVSMFLPFSSDSSQRRWKADEDSPAAEEIPTTAIPHAHRWFHDPWPPATGATTHLYIPHLPAPWYPFLPPLHPCGGRGYTHIGDETHEALPHQAHPQPAPAEGRGQWPEVTH